MATETAIEWTWRRDPATGVWIPGGTINFWIGCTMVDPACAACYAEAEDAHRRWTPEGWGKGKPRYRVKGAAETARKLNRSSIKAGIPLAAFTNSLSDFFDEEVPDEWRAEAFDTIAECWALDWMILTKRAAKMNDYLTRSLYWLNVGMPNVWLGVTAATKIGVQNRVALLRATPAEKRFISAEPLLEDIAEELEPHLASGEIDMVIVGGESEHAQHPRPRPARPMHPDWALAIQTLCWKYGVAFFFKQWGEWAPAYELEHNPQAMAMCALGNVPRHEFQTGAEGRRFVFKVGKKIAGNSLDGRQWRELPPLRSLTHSREPGTLDL